jgi:hypothetical protein
LPNEGGAFGAVVVEGLVRPLARDQDAAAGDAEVFGLVGLALALSRRGGQPGAGGLDAVEQPDSAAGRARGYAELGDEAAGVFALPFGGV